MKRLISRSPSRLTVLTGCHLVLAAPLWAQNPLDFQTPSIYESYDNNPLGDMVGKPTGGYGVMGNYILQGATATGTFSVVSGGLAFGSFNVITPASKCVQVNAGDTPTGVGILVEGGKVYGDTDYYVYDKLYCSYLVNFTNVSTLNTARAEVRTSTASSGGDQFQVHMDASAVSEGATTGANKIQPALSYKGTTYDRAVNPVTNSLKVDDNTGDPETYLMIGRFNNTGNALSVATNSTWNSGDSTITVTSNSGIVVGQLAQGTGIAADSIVTGVSGTSVTLNKATTAAGSATSVSFRFIIGDYASAVVSYTSGSSSFSTSTNTSGITVGMYVTGTGVPANTTVTNITGTTTKTITLSAAFTSASATGGSLLNFRSAAPVTATWSSGATVITVSRNPGIQVGQLVQGTGIATNSTVQQVNGNQITLTLATTAAGSGTVVNFFQRTGSSSLYALSLPQYQYFASLTPTPAEELAGITVETKKELHLDTAGMGTGSNQVTVRIVGTPATSGSVEFGQGRYIHLVASGTNASRQTYKMDELRYGFTLKSVTQPTPYLPVPSNDFAAYDDGTYRFWGPWDNGYGWKGGYYEVEETASTKGAFSYNMTGYPPVGNSPGSELTPGGGDYLYVETRFDQGTDQGLRRRPDPAVVDMTKPYTVSFDYQLKSGFATFTQFADRIQIGADALVSSANVESSSSTNFGPNPTRPNFGTSGGTNVTWMVGVVGADESAARPMYGKRWYFYDYQGASLNDLGANFFVKGNMVLASDDTNADSAPDTDAIPAIDSGGGIYSFTIEVNPLTNTYRATIAHRENSLASTPVKKFTKGGLHFRDNGQANTLFWGISKGNAENRVFALDNVRVSQGVDYFPEWIATYSSITAAGDKLRSADPDSDGRKNFLEYALDGNPASGASSGKVSQTVSTISASQYHTLTLPVRTGFSFSAGTAADLGDQISNYTANEGLKYKIEGSYDLVNWNETVVEVTPALASSPALTASPGWEYKTFRLSQPISPTFPKGFLRAVVETTK